ncbi:hypothetical protein HCZ30_00465 [Marivivens donghaensis]|uniref:Uncharacterized protein n=1 Tax=Marivivens donghaensis TaxID=1699413 RepID=A0ABX0VW54_9RHOB|nr:hypothetical protein [Marivivens donghaensis]NIY70902.1 hypothetical protein [Marivivens donghaensis]
MTPRVAPRKAENPAALAVLLSGLTDTLLAAATDGNHAEVQSLSLRIRAMSDKLVQSASDKDDQLVRATLKQTGTALRDASTRIEATLRQSRLQGRKHSAYGRAQTAGSQR